jgi:hypothetical protein
MPVIGYLANRSAGDSVDLVAALKEAGYAEGKNAAIEFRSADNQYESLRDWRREDSRGPFQCGI